MGIRKVKEIRYWAMRLQGLMLVCLSFILSTISTAQIHFNLGIEAGYQHSIIQTKVDLGDYVARSTPNVTAAALGQLLFPNGFGLETGFRTGLRDYWFKQKGVPRRLKNEQTDIHQSIHGIPFTLVKQSSGNFQKEFTWRYSLGAEVNWYRLENFSPEVDKIAWQDPVLSITVGGGVQYDCFLAELSGSYALDAPPSYPVASNIGINDPISPKFHVIQLALKCYFYQWSKKQGNWF